MLLDALPGAPPAVLEIWADRLHVPADDVKTWVNITRVSADNRHFSPHTPSQPQPGPSHLPTPAESTSPEPTPTPDDTRARNSVTNIHFPFPTATSIKNESLNSPSIPSAPSGRNTTPWRATPTHLVPVTGMRSTPTEPARTPMHFHSRSSGNHPSAWLEGPTFNAPTPPPPPQNSQGPTPMDIDDAPPASSSTPSSPSVRPPRISHGVKIALAMISSSSDSAEPNSAPKTATEFNAHFEKYESMMSDILNKLENED